MAGALVLIVEDNDKNRKLVRDVLTFKGYEVIETETGEEGVRLARERSPSLVLMDIRLPGIDGVEALRQLRAEPTTREIPVMAMTTSVIARTGRRLWGPASTGTRASRSRSRTLSRQSRSSLNVAEHEV